MAAVWRAARYTHYMYPAEEEADVHDLTQANQTSHSPAPGVYRLDLRPSQTQSSAVSDHSCPSSPVHQDVYTDRLLMPPREAGVLRYSPFALAQEAQSRRVVVRFAVGIVGLVEVRVIGSAGLAVLVAGSRSRLLVVEVRRKVVVGVGSRRRRVCRSSVVVGGTLMLRGGLRSRGVP